MIFRTRRALTRRMAGFSLIELMVALVLSLILIGGVGLLFLSGRVAATDTERLSRAQESLRFSATFLHQDIRMAGYSLGNDFVDVSAGQLVVRYQTPQDCTGGSTTAETEGELGDATLNGITENRYFVDGESRLVCQGKRDNTVVLLDRVERVAFATLPVGGSAGPFGIRATLEVTGLPTYEFTVAMRNRIVGSAPTGG